MVRTPLTPEQIAAGRRLGTTLRAARAGRTLDDVAAQAGISPETLRKIETGRLPSPAFGTVVGLSTALGIDLQLLADVWCDAGAPAAAS
ncbi:helix-turn-helix domain-containing protein [Mycobacterium sp. 21AC1]|uniref:helix-turn-helix domain-containing protein n=1 Tax=[Mycobacterium] appelbergii TaxID=2939269 RepID=UPI00293924F5|nr:helix-turn-helix transcriptional regulator [Mycobacterium sp. 21AC1]MDV3124401.1 helix-turn-helix domain-containing protein [Mycobacterium sp. 21AC1]